jgi:hypothetical protein
VLADHGGREVVTTLGGRVLVALVALVRAYGRGLHEPDPV